MENLLKKYLETHGLRQSEFARIIDCHPSVLCAWYYRKSVPHASNAWKIHKATKGAVPISYWGYTISKGRVRKTDEKINNMIGARCNLPRETCGD